MLIDGVDTIDIPYPCRAVIKGDSKHSCIMAASIIAKTIRDSMMLIIDQLSPQYKFSSHKGYPTAVHQELLIQYGLTKYHRKTFKPCKSLVL